MRGAEGKREGRTCWCRNSRRGRNEREQVILIERKKFGGTRLKGNRAEHQTGGRALKGRRTECAFFGERAMRKNLKTNLRQDPRPRWVKGRVQKHG